jgi:hypothetical protein
MVIHALLDIPSQDLPAIKTTLQLQTIRVNLVGIWLELRARNHILQLVQHTTHALVGGVYLVHHVSPLMMLHVMDITYV